MNTNQTIPASQNQLWGFWNEMRSQANTAWPLAMTTISNATSQPLESVRAFLDSRHGRHFADDVINQLHAGHALCDAINAATQQWMDWKIGRQTSKDYGIPKKLPYLIGFVVQAAIDDESLTA